MSVRLRLTRVGGRKDPIWRVVAADQRSPRDGRVIETVGRYNPQRQPSEIILDRERLTHWIERGASPSATVRRLMQADSRTSPAASAGNGAAPNAADEPAAEPTRDDAPGESPQAGSPTVAPADDEPGDDEPAAPDAGEDGTPVPPEPAEEDGPAAEIPAGAAPAAAASSAAAPEPSS